MRSRDIVVCVYVYVDLRATHHHPDPDFLPAALLLDRFVEDDIQEDLSFNHEGTRQLSVGHGCRI